MEFWYLFVGLTFLAAGALWMYITPRKPKIAAIPVKTRQTYSGRGDQILLFDSTPLITRISYHGPGTMQYGTLDPGFDEPHVTWSLYGPGDEVENVDGLLNDCTRLGIKASGRWTITFGPPPNVMPRDQTRKQATTSGSQARTQRRESGASRKSSRAAKSESDTERRSRAPKASEGAWPCGGGSAARSNSSDTEVRLSTDTIGKIRQRWSFPCERGVHVQPIVVDGRVYFGTPNGWGTSSDTPEPAITCVDAASGRLLWINDHTGSYNSNRGDLIGSPTYFEGRLFCQFDNGPLWAIDAKTGSAATALLVGDCGQRSDEPAPTIYDGMLYHANYDTVRVYSVAGLRDGDRMGGMDLAWIAEQTVLKGHYVMGAISVDDGWACAVTPEGAWIGPSGVDFALAKLVRLPRQVRDSRPIPGQGVDPDNWEWTDITSTGVAAGFGHAVSTVVLEALDPEGTGYLEVEDKVKSFVVCFRLASKKVGWFRTAVNERLTDCAIAHGKTFFASTAGTVTCVDLRTGKDVWSTKTSSAAPIQAAPLVANGVVYVGDSVGRLLGLAVDTGEQLWEADIASPVLASPAIADGWLFVPAAGGLIALTVN